MLKQLTADRGKARPFWMPFAPSSPMHNDDVRLGGQKRFRLQKPVDLSYTVVTFGADTRLT